MHPTRATDSELTRAREAYGRRAWADAFRAFQAADAAAPLEAEDLRMLSLAAALSGLDQRRVDLQERLHHQLLAEGRTREAARAGFWLASRLQGIGKPAEASGWYARLERLVSREATPCAEHGFLLLPVAQRHLATGALEEAFAAATDAARIGERFGEPDLVALARSLQGRVRLRQGRVSEGLALLDEAMVTASTDGLVPVVPALVYCALIDGCRQVYALDRCREWTATLVRWCDAQPQLGPFTGICQVHRVEVLELNGEWDAAVAEARRACERIAAGLDPVAAPAAFYQCGEMHRLRGELDLAESAYREAHRHGHAAQPGMALLRLAQGRAKVALAAVQGALSSVGEPLARARLLPATVEIALGAGDLATAEAASAELGRISTGFESEVLGAMAAQARGAVLLAQDNARAALEALRPALATWQRLGAPYLAARVRVALGGACRAIGDEDGAALELAAARRVFEELGARPDLARLAPPSAPRAGRSDGLTPRELEVLRLLATGRTNRAIARSLSLSEKTVDRHVSNIFLKLDVGSRSAATAYAFRHGLAS